jgi:hypothetical protein
MAGNDGDLLKQATQAMMSRYEGKILGCCSFTEGSRAALGNTQVVISGLRSFQQDEGAEFCTDPLCTTCARVLVRVRVLLS